MALDGSVRVGALHGNGSKLVARSLQIHVFGADGSHLLRMDARGCILADACMRRSQRYILACSEGRISRLVQITVRFQVNIALGGDIPCAGKRTVGAEVLDRDIPCHIPADSNNQRIGIVLNAHIAGNSRFLTLVGLNAVHGDVIKLVLCIFQQQ